MIDRDISRSGVEPADCIRRATCPVLMLGQPATKKWNQAAADELGNGQSGSRGERFEGLRLIVGQLNLCTDHEVACCMLTCRHSMIASALHPGCGPRGRLPIAHEMTSKFRGAGVFGEDLPVAPDADPQVRLPALVGRQA